MSGRRAHGSRGATDPRRAFAWLLVAATLAVAGCDARPGDDAPAGEGGAPRIDADGNPVGPDGTVPDLGAAAPVEYTFELQADVAALRAGRSRLVPLAVTLIDANRVTVPNTQISWQASAGLLERASFATDESGTGSATLRVPADFRTGAVEVTVTAAASSASLSIAAGSAPQSQELSFTMRDDADATLTGGDAVTFTATLVDANRAPVGERAVEWSATDGLLQDAVALTDANGTSTVVLIVPDGAPDRPVTVSVESGAHRASSTLIVDDSGAGDATAAFELRTGAGAERLPGGTVVSLDAVLFDGARSPLGERRVSWSADGGVLRDVVSTTDADGAASAAIVLPRTEANSEVIVSIASGLARRSVRLLVAGDPDAVTAAPTRLDIRFEVPNGGARVPSGGDVTLVATLLDQSRNPVADRPVSWSAEAGALRGAGAASDADGNVTATFRAPVTDVDASVGVMLVSGLVEERVTVRVAGDSGAEALAARRINFEVFADATDVPTGTGGTGGTVRISATVSDANRVPVAGRAVSWSASDGVLQDVVATTDANGVVSAALRLPRDYLNRDIHVDIASGDHATRASVRTYGTTVDVTGTDSVVYGDDAELEIRLRDGNGRPIANRAVSVTSKAGHEVRPGNDVVTGADGIAAVTVVGPSASDLITVSAFDPAAGMDATHAIEVSSDRLSFDPDDTAEVFTVGGEHRIAVVWTQGGVPIVGQFLRVTTTAGRIVGGDVRPTDEDGWVDFGIASASAGPARITVAAADGEDPSASVDVEFVADTPASIDLYSASTRVYTGDRTSVSAIVRDADGNPVKNRAVAFAGTGLLGGQLRPPTARTDGDGRASVDFVAGDAATEFDGVTISASADGVDSRTDARLTVVERVLNVTLGAGNRIDSTAPFTQYSKAFVVQVADGSGTPIEGATVALSIRPVEYYKGGLEVVDADGLPPGYRAGSPDAPAFSADRWEVRTIDWSGRNADPSAESDVYETCAAEDADRDRVRDAGEDINGNGTLDPQDPAVLAPSEAGRATLRGDGTLRTDATGTGHLQMIYPRSNAVWSTVEITARAQALGTEAEDTFTIRLPMSAEEVSDTGGTPSNVESPYGTDAGVLPASSGTKPDDDGCYSPD